MNETLPGLVVSVGVIGWQDEYRPLFDCFESSHNQSAVLSHVWTLFVAVDCFFRHWFFVWLRNDSDKEIEEDDKHEYFVYDPHEPDEVNHDATHNGLFMVIKPEFHSWNLQVT